MDGPDREARNAKRFQGVPIKWIQQSYVPPMTEPRPERPQWQRISISAVRVYLLFGLILWAAQEIFLFPGLLRPAANGPRRANYAQIRIDIDGRVIHGWRHTSTHDRVVVMTHGNAEFASDLFPYGEWLDQQGWSWVCMEYRGFDDAPGWPTEDALAADLRAILGWLPSQGWSLDRTIVHGRSVGGGVAVAGTVNSPIAGLVLESTFDSVAAIAQRTLPMMVYPVRLLLRSPLDSRARLADSKLPVFQVHDTEDAVVPFARALALNASLHHGTWSETTGNPHGTPIVAVPEIRQNWFAWLEARVPARAD